jgi:mono/diheme cytochrome c family protein
MAPFTGGLVLAGAALALAVATACGGAASSDRSPAGSAPAASTAPIKVDLDAIFPQGPGRELVLGSCQNCHTFVPIVILQMDKDAWRRNSLDHRERVATLSDEQFQQAYAYLSEHFGPHRPVPQLPPDLLKSWTTY